MLRAFSFVVKIMGCSDVGRFFVLSVFVVDLRHKQTAQNQDDNEICKAAIEAIARSKQ